MLLSEMRPNLVNRGLVEDETTLEDQADYMDLDCFPEENTLGQLASIAIT
jgi:hypothetical protein